MPKKKTPPILGDLEKQYLSVAISLPSYGRSAFAGAEAFVRQVGWQNLLERYPELYQIKPKRNGDTLEQLIRNVLEEYVAFRVGTFLKAWSAYKFPKEPFSGDAAREQKVMVTAMQFYADEIRATYPEFLAPPQGEEELYTLRCTVEYLPGGKNWELYQLYSSIDHPARYYPGKELTRRQIEDLKRHHPFMQLSREAVEQFLIQSILDDHQARLVDDPVRVLPLSMQEREKFQIVINLLREAQGETMVSVDSLSQEGVKASQEEPSAEVVYELEIEISGCQSESCTRQIRISKTQTELLAWGKEAYAQGTGTIHTQEDFACALWEVFLHWGKAELDDHDHTFETSYEDDATIQKMVEVLTSTFLSVRAD